MKYFYPSTIYPVSEGGWTELFFEIHKILLLLIRFHKWVYKIKMQKCHPFLWAALLPDSEHKKWTGFFLSNHAQFPEQRDAVFRSLQIEVSDLVAGENIHCVMVFLQGILRILAEVGNIFLHLPAEFNPPKRQFIDFGVLAALLFMTSPVSSVITNFNISSYYMADSFCLI